MSSKDEWKKSQVFCGLKPCTQKTPLTYLSSRILTSRKEYIGTSNAYFQKATETEWREIKPQSINFVPSEKLT